MPIGRPVTLKRLEPAMLQIIEASERFLTYKGDTQTALYLVDSIREGWQDTSMALYRQGSWGPHEADLMMQADGNSWVDLDARAKADQRQWVEYWGGRDKVAGSSQILFTPPPGISKEEAWAIPGTH